MGVKTMALMRMRESICLPANYYTDVTQTVPEAIRESMNKAHGAARLTESTDTAILVKELYKLKESGMSPVIIDKVVKKLQESGVSNERKIYRVPVGRFNNINGNKRRYTEALWNNVMNNQTSAWQGLCGLADHPAEDSDPGSFKNSSIVWLGMEIDQPNNLVYGIGTFVGDYGHLAQEIIESGGRVGFSSSGFGELMGDGETVNPDTFQIERLADVVLNPSQEVYGDMSMQAQNIEYNKSQAVQESMSAILRNKTNPIKENTNMDATNTSSALSKAEQKALRGHINNFLQESSKIENPLKRLSELNDILEIINEGKFSDLEADIVTKLEETRATIEADINAAHEMKETLGIDSIEGMGTAAAKLAETSTLLADQVTDYKTLCEGLTERNKQLSKELKKVQLSTNFREAKAEKASFEKNQDIVAQEAALDALTEELMDNRKIAAREIALLKEANAKYKKGSAELERKNSILETKLSEANKVLANNAKLREGKISISAAEKADMETIKSENETLKGMLERHQTKNRNLQEKIADLTAELAAEKEKFVEMTTSNYHVQPRYTERVSKHFNWKENNGIDIENYWTDLTSRYGENILPYEAKIRDAKTLREAQQAFLKVLPMVDSNCGAARSATFHEGGAQAEERMRILENSGMQVDTANDIDRVNQQALERMAMFGMK